jgi:hypothetical protein
LINLTSKTDTQKLEKTIANLIAQNSILSYYQSISKKKDFEPSKELFVILKTNYPYEDILFDLKIPFERVTQSKLYAKYDCTQQQIVFEIFTDNTEERHKACGRLTAALQKYLDKYKTTYKQWLTDIYPDIWAFELSNSEMKQLLNNDLHNLMFVLKNNWTQDYAVSVALTVVAKILHTLYNDESECTEIINILYENWGIFLFEGYTTTDIYQINKNKEFRIASLSKQVEAMNNDITLLAHFSENEEINKHIQNIQKTITDLISKQCKDDIKRNNIILGLLSEVCSSLGVYKKNLPYIALLIKTHKKSLWKII